MTTNMDQDYGIRFVAFTSAPADPYVGGTDLGTVAFGSLTGGGTTAALTGVSLGTAGTYTVYAVLNPVPSDVGCRPSAVSATLTVNALPVVTMAIPANQDEYCVNDAITLINLAGNPTGGVYSGSGVTDLANGISFTFNPALAGVGVHTVTYTFTDINGCTNTATDDITVLALPNVTMTVTEPATCITDGVQTGRGGGTPTGGTYSGPGVSDDGKGMTYRFNPAEAGDAM